MKVPKVITSWKNSRRQTVSNVKNIKRRERFKIHSTIFLDQSTQRKHGFGDKKCKKKLPQQKVVFKASIYKEY